MSKVREEGEGGADDRVDGGSEHDGAFLVPASEWAGCFRQCGKFYALTLPTAWVLGVV